MYNVIFLRASVTDEHRNETDGLMRIFTCETQEEVYDIMRREYLEHLGNVHKGRTVTHDIYGDCGFVVMHNGTVVDFPGYVGNIDVEVYDTPSIIATYDTDIEYAELRTKTLNHHELMVKFIRSLQGDEENAKKSLHEKDLADQKIEKEKQTLRDLLQKYPEMIGK